MSRFETSPETSMTRDSPTAPLPEAGGERAPAVDEATFEALTKLVGAPKMESLLGKLAAQLEGRFASADGGGDLAALGKAAHKLASSAGMLGFAALSRSCAKLEHSVQAHEDVAAPRAEARDACVEALGEISRRLLRTPLAKIA